MHLTTLLFKKEIYYFTNLVFKSEILALSFGSFKNEIWYFTFLGRNLCFWNEFSFFWTKFCHFRLNFQFFEFMNFEFETNFGFLGLWRNFAFWGSDEILYFWASDAIDVSKDFATGPKIEISSLTWNKKFRTEKWNFVSKN